jgi:hypothetical protein
VIAWVSHCRISITIPVVSSTEQSALRMFGVLFYGYRSHNFLFRGVSKWATTSLTSVARCHINDYCSRISAQRNAKTIVAFIIALADEDADSVSVQPFGVWYKLYWRDTPPGKMADVIVFYTYPHSFELKIVGCCSWMYWR